MFNTDVATGKVFHAGYSSIGPNTASTKSETPTENGTVPCYLWDILETCTGTQKLILKNGTAIVEDFVLVGYKQANGTETYYNGTSGREGGGNGTVSPSSGATHNAATRTRAYKAMGIVLVSIVFASQL